MPDNEQFKTVLHDAKLICRQKFEAVKENFGQDNTDVITIQDELKSVYGQFDNPAVWSQQLTYDQTEIMSLILKVGVADPSDLDNFLKVTRDLLKLLKEDILKEPLAAIAMMLPSDWNTKTLDALRLTHQRIAGRETYFKNHGQDLSQNAQFKKIDEEHDIRAAAYRLALNGNIIESSQTDVILITRYGELIKAAVAVPIFITLYKGFSDFVKNELPAA